MNFDRHPMKFLLSLAKKYADRSPVFAFKSYKVNMDHVYGDNYREVEEVRIRGAELEGKLTAFLTESEDNGLDVVVDSSVSIWTNTAKEACMTPALREAMTADGGRVTLHIPMIDFSCKALPDVRVLKELWGTECPPSRLKFYSSGRSFHAYGDTLLKPFEWTDFIGTLLLVNTPEQPDVVDTRWVGHRIRKGYGALRLTKSSPKYLEYPTEVASIFSAPF